MSASRAAQASEARLYIYIYTNINRVLIVGCMYIVYLCNELIEETAWRKKLIFGMCGSLLAMAPLSSELRRKC